LNFGIDFPRGWSVDNRPDSLLAASADGAIAVRVRAAKRREQLSPRQFLLQQDVKESAPGRSLELKDFPSYTTRVPINTQFGRRHARVIVLFDGDHAYQFTGITRSADDMDRADSRFTAVARSFHHLSADEQKRASALRLHLIKAAADTRFETLAQHSPIRKYAESELRLMNDRYPKGEPQAGQTLKVVR